MHVLFIIDPINSLKAYKDTSVSIMRALIDRGHRVSIAMQNDVFIDSDNIVKSNANSICIDDDLSKSTWHSITDVFYRFPLSNFDAVLMRKDPPFDLEYLYTTHLLEISERQGAKIFNSPGSIRNHPEKLSIMEFPEIISPTLVTSNIGFLKNFYVQYKDIIIKPLDGMGGVGVFRIKEDDSNLNVILEVSTHNGMTTVMAQKYIPDIVDGDKRILIVGNRIIPFCLARLPLMGDHRGNLAVGGIGKVQKLSDSDINIANIVYNRLHGRGLYIIGLDIIGRYLTEINVTSPTCFVEISEQAGFNIANIFVEFLEKKVN
ncbi:glutathione synthase [Candidatus Kinetoplastibacterium blastocrithidii TCC012E]|uniref:Glutathione synthetase n=1 Tax=Candidatus Kinetoplastidibacterium blastocrithidiae TCC012E TaxID=1208922 RepID=M1M028_9PROT|nr:glutathione synthase [Candidatus Kinetoplastibacterium blastocrithidii]AFZ83542.1 glutathione synthetase [Candidatus Kinetoplastibacterium blastocrithidii (ex Strigomonas culicis)]AGF49661.1 glutathione synthase [Candidatus Kinetoplastibacterium blastocrithidii TCC012E]